MDENRDINGLRLELKKLREMNMKLVKLLDRYEQIKNLISPIINQCTCQNDVKSHNVNKLNSLLLEIQYEKQSPSAQISYNELFNERDKNDSTIQQINKTNVVDNKKTGDNDDKDEEEEVHSNSSQSIDNENRFNVNDSDETQTRHIITLPTKPTLIMLHKQSDQSNNCDQNQPKTITKSPTPFICDWPNCGKRFKLNVQVKAHMLQHTGQCPFVCQVEGCDKRYRTNESLKYHQFNYHKFESVVSKRNISKIIQKRIWQCEICGKILAKKHNLIRHKLTHDKVKPVRPIPCEWPGCDYKSNCMSTYKRHQATHTDERPFACQWPNCGKSFRKPYALKEHTWIHTGEKPYACDIAGCKKRCRQVESLKIHYQKTHQIYDKVMTEKLVKRFKIRKFLCDVDGCQKRFKKKESLESHLKNFHQFKNNQQNEKNS